ncbi:hypothetical protein GJ496_003742 [Pomphorhynchus laevis]|nr:hypothetical protein GJ496_003742 [Pomphorhynchus laevis]
MTCALCVRQILRNKRSAMAADGQVRTKNISKLQNDRIFLSYTIDTVNCLFTQCVRLSFYFIRLVKVKLRFEDGFATAVLPSPV